LIEWVVGCLPAILHRECGFLNTGWKWPSHPRTADEKAHHIKNFCPGIRMSATILVIDDSEDDRRLYQRAFRGFDCFFNLTMAPSAEAGFARIAEAKPDLILLDYNLPDMDGLSFMQMLAAHSDTPIPIIMLTGETSATLAVEVMKHGADDYLVKDTEGRYLRLLPGVAGRVMATHTQREEALRLRQENEALLLRNHALMQNSRDGIHIMDAHGNLVEANDAFYRMLGYTREEMARFNVADWEAQWSAAEMREHLRLFTGQSIQFETVHRRKDGTLIDVEISLSRNEVEGQHFLFATSRDITGRKRAERRISYSESLYRGLFENMSSGVAVYSAVDGGEDFTFSDFNRAGELMENVKREDIIGKRLTDCFPGVKEFGLFAVLQRVWKTGEPEHFPISFYRDGRISGWRDNHVFRLPSGEVIATYDDVTAQKQAEQSLRESEANLRAILDNSPYLTWLKDTRGRYITINKVFADYLRLEDPKQVIGKTDLDFQPEELAKKYQADDAEVIAARRQKHVEEPAFDGENHHWVETYKTPIIDAHGEVLGTVGFARDITERIRAENIIREKERRLQAHIENSPMAVVSWDRDLNVTQWAGEAERMFGWTAAETVGKPLMDLNMIYAEDIPLVRETMAKIRGAERCVISPNRNVTKDGRIIHCVWYNSILSNEDGAMESVLSLVLDVTGHKQIEQEMLALNIHLKQEVTTRTADLAALTAHVQKIAEAERANLARELHDELGSTLVGISMELGRLKGKISNPDHLQDLSAIKNLLATAAHTTREVVNQLYPTFLDTYGYVAAVEYLVKEFGKHSGVEVDLLLPEEEFAMEHAFALAAYRITQECLTNIAKHAEAGKVRIEAKTGGGFLDLTIHDNGKGLPGTRNSGSHGIFGMMERARYLGGQMEIEGAKGNGTTAHLRLPLAVAKPKSKKRVLVVDDHAIVRNALRQLLGDQTDDFSVEGEAADGKAGVQLAIEGAWDIMLLDISLPEKNGIKVLEEVVAAKPDLPIIMLSSHTKDEYAEIALSKGAACYIEKGETDVLVEAMRRATRLQ
jgi:PAS domain S-box-containing protein